MRFTTTESLWEYIRDNLIYEFDENDLDKFYPRQAGISKAGKFIPKIYF